MDDERSTTTIYFGEIMLTLVSGNLEHKRSVMDKVEVWFDEMETNGWLDEHNINPPWQRYYALTIKGRVVSFLIYERRQKNGYITIWGAWTDPEFRRQGLYSQLWDALVNRERARGKIRMIKSGLHRNNTVSAYMQHKQGRMFKPSWHQDYIVTEFTL